MESAIADLTKLLICVLLTQFGKTFEAIKCMFMQFERDEKYGRSIHMVFTMNTLLNNSQFAKRLKEIQDKYGHDAVVVFASRYKGTLYDHVKSLKVLKGLCSNARTCPRVVVMCSNRYRFEDGVKFLKWIDDVETTVCIKRCFVYYDELHKYINDTLRSQIVTIHALRCVSEIVGLTATPFNIWKAGGAWNALKIRYVSDFYEENYCGFKDMIFRNVDFPCDSMPGYSNWGSQTANALTSRYIMRCIEQNPEILAEGSRVFIPGHIQKKNHFDIRLRIFNHKPETLVVVLNGQEKTLSYMLEDKMISIDIGEDDEEVCTTISNTIKKHGFGGRPLVITGLLCVGMGQTLTHYELGSFTSAIIGHDDHYLDDIYQLFGRITGRMKFWGDKYCKTVVYCPKSVMLRFKAAEHLARNMALKHNNTVATKQDYLAPLRIMGEAGQEANKRLPSEKVIPVNVKRPGQGPLSKSMYDYGWREFDTEAAAMEFWGTLPGSAPRPITRFNEKGFMLCSATKGSQFLGYENVLALISPEKGAGMSVSTGEMKSGETLIRRYACYKNKEINEPTFVIRWIKRI